MLILKDEPMPEHIPRTPLSRALVAMEVGECIRVTGLGKRPRYGMAATQWGRRLGRKYRVRKTGANTFGVWRVA